MGTLEKDSNELLPNGNVRDFLHEYSGVSVMVLGATGFIGRWVARLLCEAGANVYLPVRDRAAAQAIFADYGISGEMVELDLLDFDRVRSVYRHVCPKITFNLAGYGVDRGEQDDDLATRINVDLVGNVCSAISTERDKTWPGLDIVHVGTAMEYGLTEGDLREDLEARPTTLYGRSKLAGTKMVAAHCRSSSIKGITARLFSVYGPGESTHRLLPSLFKATDTEGAIPLTEGLHQRDFVYVEDVAEGLLRLGLTSPVPGEVVNLATGILTTVRSFVETAADILEISKERLRFGALPTRVEEMKHDPVAIWRYVSLSGWTPSTTIADGIWKTVGFTNLMIPNSCNRGAQATE